MALTEAQRVALSEKAREIGVSPDELIREAESLSAGPTRAESTDDAPTKEQPALFMYLLPFVRVREVRKVWLGLDEAFPGDNEIASAWAARQGGGGGDEPPPGAAQP